MTQTQLILLATLGSAGLLAGAFVFQALGFAPCAMCLWQRWPHAAAVVLGALALTVAPARPLAWLGALAAAVSGGLGVYHTGVERDWWDGPASCSGGDGLGALDGAALLPGAEIAPVVLCDEVAWELFGLSMASWNASVSFALAAIWIFAATTRPA